MTAKIGFCARIFGRKNREIAQKIGNIVEESPRVTTNLEAVQKAIENGKLRHPFVIRHAIDEAMRADAALEAARAAKNEANRVLEP